MTAPNVKVASDWLGVDRNDSERERLGLMLHVMVNPDVGGLVSCI